MYMQLSREIFSQRGVVYINTFLAVLGVIGAIGAVASIVSLALYWRDRNKK